MAKLTDDLGLVISAEVADHDDGSYTLTYKATRKGRHSLAVYVREKPIFGSPFEVLVTAGIDCDKIGPLLTKFGSAGVIGASKNDDYYEPWGVVCNKNGSIIVTDHNNHCIQVI